MNQPVVLITGALTGIGRATAFAFAKTGARLVISGRTPEVGNALAKELSSLTTEVVFIPTDVRFETEIQTLIDKTVQKFGRLDIAVNNAGTEGQPGLVAEQTPESYRAVFDTNVLGTLLSLKHELRVMLAQGHGSIINLSSVLGKIGAPGGSVYSASKHAIEGLTKSAALEVASKKIRVNAVAPGPIDTEMLSRFAGNSERKARMAASLPMKRMGQAEEVAQAILFLASEQASFITGQVLVVDGGKLA